MKIVFMGTPSFSVPPLTSIEKAGHEILAVFTQPDKPKNRGHKIVISEVKEYALKRNIPVYQPSSFRKGDDSERSIEILRELSPDCIVVVAYGQLLPQEVLDIPKYGCINIHASLLPKYRGAAPIQRCIMDGEKKTGVTTMYMAKGLDTGDMIMSRETEINDRMTASELHDILSELGAELIVETLSAIENGKAVRVPQTDENTCYAKMIEKEECRIDFSTSAENIYNKIRGLSSNPCSFTFLGNKRLKVYFAEKCDNTTTALPGTIINTGNMTVACGDGNALIFTDIQLEGGKRITAEEFLRGRKLEAGTRFE